MRTELFIKIERNERGSGIKNGTHRTHHSCQQCGHDQANEADGQEVQDESRIGKVRRLQLVTEQCVGHDARQNEHEDGQDFEEAGKNRSRFGVALVPGRKHALDNHLIGAPVPNAEDRCTEEDACPREVGIRHGLDHVKVIQRHHRAEMLKATNTHQANDRQCHRAGNEDQRLDGVCVDDRRQSARDGVNPGSDDQNYRRLPQRPASHPLEDHASSVKLHGNFRENVRDDGDGREIHGGLPVETALQKFRHGENVAAQVKRHKNPA